MRQKQNVQLFVCLAVVLYLPIASISAQQSTRIFKADNQSIDDLDPSAIESELIDAADQELNRKPVFQKTSVQKTNGFDKNQQFNNTDSAVNGTRQQSPVVKSFNGSGSFNQNQPFHRNNTTQEFNGNQTTNKGFSNRGNFSSSIPVSIPNQQNGNLYETKSTPTIQTQITAPRTTNVNQTARFFIQAINVGTTDVTSVKLIATLPEHAKFVSSNPQPSDVNGQQYEFTLNGLSARANQTVQIDVTPTEKLPLNIGTQIQIESQQQFAVTVQQPILEISVDSPSTIQAGKTVKHNITVTNVGDGVAEGVRINTERPEELEVGSDPQKTLVPKLVPGQSTKFVLSSFAINEGQSDILFQVSARGAETRQAKSPVRIIRPELGVQVLGPSQNYIGREGIYTIQLQNTSEMPITEVAVQLAVPSGLRVDTISQQAKINKNTGTLSWLFNEIPGNQQQVIQFRAKSVAVGSQVCKVDVQTRETASRQMALETQILGRADLSIRVTDSGAPVGIGSKSDFTIEVANHGSQTAEQVAVRVELPSALMPVSQPGYSIDSAGNFITFNDITVEAGKRKTFSFKVVAVSQGEHIVRGTVTLEGSVQTISSENSIFVFEAENAKVSDALVPEIRR